MSQLVTMSDQSIFVAFDKALMLHVKIGVFILTKTQVSRKRSIQTVTATNYDNSSWIDCLQGWGRVEEKCVKCPAGYRSNEETRYPCVICPGGTYTSEPGLVECTACNSSTSTPSEGATSEDMCKVLCNIPPVTNGSTFPFTNFNITSDQNITITCDPNPNDFADKTYFDLEFGQSEVVHCHTTLPGCYRTCSLPILPENQVFVGEYRVGDTIRYRQRLEIKCSDRSSVFATCEKEGVLSVPGCGEEATDETASGHLEWIVVGVALSALVVAGLILLTFYLLKKRQKMKEKEASDMSKSIAMATNIYSGQEHVVLSRPFDARTFVMHVQVSVLI